MDGGRSRMRDGPSARLTSAWTLASLDSRLGLKRRGREDGAREHPPTSSDEPAEAEREIQAAIEAERAEIASERIALQRALEQRLGAFKPAAPDFSGPVLEAKLALKQIEARVSHDWAGAAERARIAKADLLSFRETHRLNRAAQTHRTPLLQAGLLLCAAAAESVFSAALFAEEDARGLLGGAVTAIGLSGANVTLGFLSGFVGLRYLQHRSAWIKSAGALCFAAFGLLALMLNLFAADWRDQLAKASGAIGPESSDASFHLWSLLNLDSPQAIILLMLGGGVWAFATLKGYATFDDPYPDYGKMARAAEAADAEVSELRGEALQQLDSKMDEAGAALAQRMEKARADMSAMSAAFDEGAREAQALDARDRAVDELHAAALKLYRDANLSARTSPAPAHFADLPAPSPRADALAGAAALIDAGRAIVAEAERAHGAALSEADGAREQALARLSGQSSA